MDGKKIVIIGDPHAHPEYDNSRFIGAGNLLLEEQPDQIICIGDMADMPSLSSYDKGTKGFEGRRYNRDVEATRDANDKLFAAIMRYNHTHSRWHKKQYKPKTVMTLGNHEHRVSRAVNSQAELDGTISINDFEYQKYWNTIVPFQEKYIEEAVAFSHYFSSGVMNRPIGGERVGLSLINKNYMSSVQGHSHLFDHAIRTRADGTRLHGLSVGCFVHPEYNENWCKGSRHLWWEGIIILDNVRNGDFTFRQITTDEIYSIWV